MATQRDSRVSEVLAHALEDHPQPGRWLVVDDRPGLVVERLDGAGGVGEVQRWHRLALEGRAATAAPPDGPFDGIVLRQPRGTVTLIMLTSLLGARLAPGGQLLVGGANDEGARSMARHLSELFGQVEVVATRRHCRVVAARRPRADLRGELEGWSLAVGAEVAGVSLSWRSWPPLFAHDRLDAGTKMLLESLPPLEGAVLDFACGAGVVGQFLLRRGDPIELTLSDVDPLALHAAHHNVPGVPAQLADGLPPGGPWQHIVSNPPLHLGKDEHRGTLAALAAGAPERLRRDGSLWLVVQGSTPVRRALQGAFTTVERVAHSPSYAVWRATGIPRARRRDRATGIPRARRRDR